MPDLAYVAVNVLAFMDKNGQTYKMTRPAQSQRRRYSPEVRRSMILDQTADLIARDGVAAVTMEQVAQHCDISKSLIYNYFESLSELLKELLDRELKTLRVRQYEAAKKAETFEELVRGVTHEYLAYIDERGLIIERLQSEPSISDTDNPTQYGRAASVDYLAPLVAKNFDMPADLAEAVTDISYGLPAAAGQYLLSRKMTLQEVEDITVSMIIGSVVTAKNDYLIKRRSLSRERRQDAE